MPDVVLERRFESEQSIVVDIGNNFVWQGCVAGQSDEHCTGGERIARIAMNWRDAISYCDRLVYGLYDDWRLPGYLELAGLLDDSDGGANWEEGGILDHEAFPLGDPPGSVWWVSSYQFWNCSGDRSRCAFLFSTYEGGYFTDTYKDGSYPEYARCIRSGL